MPKPVIARRRPLHWLAACLASTTVVVACGGSSDQAEPGGEVEPSDDAPSGQLTVLAAASLTESFEALADYLAAEYPDLEIVFSFGPSSGLIEQVAAGAPGDVLATADTTTMSTAVDGDLVAGDPILFARNTLTLAVPTGNPGGVTGLADLARDDLRIALCEPQVPCGAAAERLLDIAGVIAAPDTLESDVRDTAGKVSLGEVDAALIYCTDAAALSDTIDTIDIPAAEEVVNDYPVGLLSDAVNVSGAAVFIDALTGEPGRLIVERAGFIVP